MLLKSVQTRREGAGTDVGEWAERSRRSSDLWEGSGASDIANPLEPESYVPFPMLGRLVR